MSILLVHELHEARDRILLLRQRLVEARVREVSAYLPFLNDQIKLLDDALEKAHIPERYRVAVVGRFKVGKSSFVNKLAGERVAGVDINPETAAISVFRYDLEARADVELVSKEEWDRLAGDYEDDPKNPEVKRYDRLVNFNERPKKADKDGKETARSIIDLDELVREWVTPGGTTHSIPAHNWETDKGKRAFLAAIKKFTSSQEPLHYLTNRLTIYAPIPILRDQIELIDTPGLDDTERFRVQLTESLVKDVDAILFLTVSGASYSQSDKEFIVRQLRQRQIKHLQIIVTKCDETFENAVRDAQENGDTPPTFKDFCVRETNRVRAEAKLTLNELLQSNQLTDEEGYYFIEQLDGIPVQLISTKYHDAGEIDKGGIEGVREGLYRILSTSQRFDQARIILHDRFELVIKRLRDAFTERHNTLEKEFDSAKVREEIESIRKLLSLKLDAFGDRLGKSLGLLDRDQKAFFKILPVHLDLVTMQAKEVLSDLEKADLVTHWKRRRHGGWGYLTDLQAKIADRVFPKIEAVLNSLCGHLDTFMESAAQHMILLQGEMVKIEGDHRLTGLEPLDLAATQTPMIQTLRETFRSLIVNSRDGIVSNLDNFVSKEVQELLDRARVAVSTVLGKGTTIRQGQEVTAFYSEVRSRLTQALREHLERRIREFAEAIRTNSESVAPRIRETSEGAIRQRLEAMESALQIDAEGRKEEVSAFLSEMIGLLSNFAAEPASTVLRSTPIVPSFHPKGGVSPMTVPEPVEQHYEILEEATGYTYERIFRPYIDTASKIVIEDPYIRLTHQVDNLTRFCALAVRLGTVDAIDLFTAERNDDVEGRLETLRRDLKSRDIVFNWSYRPSIHDREVQFDNGWIVKIGRGLDIYHRPESWGSVEAADFSMRRCRQTKVDVYRTASRAGSA
jgi:hypothetical protein